MNIVYRSATRLCVERDGVIVHVEKKERTAEARRPGAGGPRSGPVVGLVIEGEWVVEAESPEVAQLVSEAVQAA